MLRVQPSVCSPFYRVREPWEKESWWPDFVTYCLVLSIWYLKSPERLTDHKGPCWVVLKPGCVILHWLPSCFWLGWQDRCAVDWYLEPDHCCCGLLSVSSAFPVLDTSGIPYFSLIKPWDIAVVPMVDKITPSKESQVGLDKSKAFYVKDNIWNSQYLPTENWYFN